MRKIFGVKIIKNGKKNLDEIFGVAMGWLRKTCRILVWKPLKTFILKNQKSLGRKCRL